MVAEAGLLGFHLLLPERQDQPTEPAVIEGVQVEPPLDAAPHPLGDVGQVEVLREGHREGGLARAGAPGEGDPRASPSRRDHRGAARLPRRPSVHRARPLPEHLEHRPCLCEQEPGVGARERREAQRLPHGQPELAREDHADDAHMRHHEPAAAPQVGPALFKEGIDPALEVFEVLAARRPRARVVTPEGAHSAHIFGGEVLPAPALPAPHRLLSQRWGDEQRQAQPLGERAGHLRTTGEVRRDHPVRPMDLPLHQPDQGLPLRPPLRRERVVGVPVSEAPTSGVHPPVPQQVQVGHLARREGLRRAAVPGLAGHARFSRGAAGTAAAAAASARPRS